MYRVKKIKIVGAAFCLLALVISLPAVCLAGKHEESGTAALALRVRASWIDLYVANEGPGDLDASYRLSGSQLGSGIRFFFFTKKGLCRSCKFSDEDNFLYRIPLSERRGNIFPGEIAGTSFFVEEVVDRYGLRDGCYAFFAQFTRRDAGKFLSRNISNVETMCIKGRKIVKP